MNTRPPSGASAAETSEYIGGIAKELRAMALKADLGFLAYLLAMAIEEADAIDRRHREKGTTDGGVS